MTLHKQSYSYFSEFLLLPPTLLKYNRFFLSLLKIIDHNEDATWCATRRSQAPRASMKMFVVMLLWAMRTCERLLTGLSEKSSNYDELAGYWFLDEFLSCLGSIIVLIHSSSVSTGNSLWYYTMPLYHYTI